MPPHANFAAVLGINQHVIQDMIRVLYLVDEIPHWLRASQEIANMFKFELDFFNDAPEFIFSAANNNKYLIKISAWGPMTVGLPAIIDGNFTMYEETREVKFEAEITVPPDIKMLEDEEEDEEGALLIFGIKFEQATLVSKSFTVLSGGDFHQGIQNLFEVTFFHNKLEEVLREELSKIGESLPVIDISFLELMLGPVLEENVELHFTPRILDNALLIGIDYIQGGFGTVGDPDQLTDITRGIGISMWTNPDVWVPHMRTQFLEGEEGVRKQVQNEGAVLNSFRLTLREGYLHISGKATKDPYGSVNFSFNIYPRLERPAQIIDYGYDEDGTHVVRHIPAREELWFEVKDSSVDVDRAWWVVLIEIVGGIISFGIITLIGESFVSMARWNVDAALNEDIVLNNRLFEFEINKNTPPILAHIENFEFHEDGVFLALSTDARFPTPRINSISHPHAPGIYYHHIDVNERLRDTTISYRIQLPFNLHREDPNLRIRWTAINMDNNIILQNSDEIAQDLIDFSFSEIYNSTQIKLTCRVYRTLGENIEDFYNGHFNVYFVDSLDRSHPYVKWSHYVYTPDVRVERDGSHTLLGGHIKYRRSKIHRTDFPERCWMVSKYSLRTPDNFRVPFGGPFIPKIEYFDILPMPIHELNAQRSKICDYCFFGGPNERNLRPLPTDEE